MSCDSLKGNFHPVWPLKGHTHTHKQVARGSVCLPSINPPPPHPLLSLWFASPVPVELQHNASWLRCRKGEVKWNNACFSPGVTPRPGARHESVVARRRRANVLCTVNAAAHPLADAEWDDHAALLHNYRENVSIMKLHNETSVSRNRSAHSAVE